MTIVAQKASNTVTLSNTFAFVDVALGITITNLNRAEVIHDARSAQAIGVPDNYSITARIINATTVRLERGGTGGTMVIHFQVIEYTVASGALVDNGAVTLTSVPQNIAIPNRTMANRYSRVSVRSTISSALEDNLVTHEVSSNTNICVVANFALVGVILVWQAVYIPDQTVHNLAGTTAGTSHNVSLAGLGIIKEEAFTIQSMVNNGSFGIDSDELKGAFISSNTNLEIYSFFNDTHDFVTQIVHRPKNVVQRNDNNYTITPFAIVLLSAVVTAESYINLCAPNAYYAPTNEATNNSQVWAHTSILNSPTSVTLQRFLSGDSTRLISEVIFLDGNPVVGGSTTIVTAVTHRRSV